MIENALPKREFFSGRRWLCLFIPPLLAFLIHLPALSAGVFWDDSALIISHPRLGDSGFITEIFGRDYGLELQARSPIGYYRPLLLLLDYGLFHLFGPSAVAYHATVLLTFCFSCFLLTAVAMRALGDRTRLLALTIGCLAAVHPVRTEFAVFFMSMPDLMIEILSLLIIAICLGFFKSWPTSLRGVAAAGLAFAAGLTKETSFFIVGALGATLLLSGLDSRRRRESLGEAFGLFAGLGAAFALRLAVGVSLPSGNSPMASVSASAARALDGFIEGLRNLIIPSKTVFMDGGGDSAVFGSLAIVASVVAVAALLVFRLTQRGRLFEALVGAWLSAGFFSLMLLRAQGYPYSDRYLPSAAAIIALVLVADNLWSRLALRSKAWGWVATLFVVGYLGISASFAWASTVRCQRITRFFAAMADDYPKLSYPRVILANMLLLQGDNIELADRFVHEAVALAPDEPRVRALGKSLAARYIAEAEYQKGLEALAWSGEVLTGDAEIWSLRATCQAGLLDYAGALNSSHHALGLAPNNPNYKRQLEEITAAAAGE